MDVYKDKIGTLMFSEDRLAFMRSFSKPKE